MRLSRVSRTAVSSDGGLGFLAWRSRGRHPRHAVLAGHPPRVLTAARVDALARWPLLVTLVVVGGGVLLGKVVAAWVNAA